MDLGQAQGGMGGVFDIGDHATAAFSAAIDRGTFSLDAVAVAKGQPPNWFRQQTPMGLKKHPTAPGGGGSLGSHHFFFNQVTREATIDDTIYPIHNGNTLLLRLTGESLELVEVLRLALEIETITRPDQFASALSEALQANDAVRRFISDT